jgi:DNA-binding FrmR family transcriptional regulator
MRDLETKKSIVARLRRIEGQLRGLQRMVEEDVPCSEILTQVAAVSAATKRVGMAMIQGFMEECLPTAGKVGGVTQKDHFKEFRKALSRYIDWS